jgi:hypothetical protein
MKTIITVYCAAGILLLGLGSAQAESASKSSAFARAGARACTNPRPLEINQRRATQHARIVQGLNNGTITSQEDAQLKSTSFHIRNNQLRDMQAHGGHLTAEEQARLNFEMNLRSKQIFNNKHN